MTGAAIPRRILVAVKHPESKSLPAVLKAAQIARATGAEIELFHALAQPLVLDLYESSQVSPALMEDQLLIRAHQRLEAIADRLRVHSIRVTISVGWDYPVYEAIIRQALKSKSDLIVAQRYSGRHLAAALMRLTDWELIRLSPVPVLLVKNPRPYRHPAVLAAVDPGHRLASGAQLDRSILRWGSALSRQLHGKLHAVHAYDFVPLIGPAQTVTGDMIEAITQQSRRNAAARFARRLHAFKIAKPRRHLMAARPIDAISEVARRTRAAIVVMGAVSRSGLSRILIGNTAERILDDVSCDILVVKPASFQSRVSRGQRGARLKVTSPVNMLGYLLTLWGAVYESDWIGSVLALDLRFNCLYLLVQSHR